MMKKKVVLHVGCGLNHPKALHSFFKTAEWEEVRLDINPSVDPDIVSNISDMNAIADESVHAIWSSHNLEHLYAHEVPLALREFFRVLKLDGFALIQLPDIQAVAREVVQGNLEEVLYQSPAGPISAIDVIWGFRSAIAGGNHFMTHKTGFTHKTLRQKLLHAGFHPVQIRCQGLDLVATAHKKNSTQTKGTKRLNPFTNKVVHDLDSELAKAVGYHQSGQLNEAEEIYTKILKDHPNHSDSLHLLGVIAHQTGNHNQSSSLINEAIRINPENADYYCSLGDVLKDQGELKNAISSYQKALELKPNFVAAYYNMANTHHGLGNFEEAIINYKNALKLNPNLVAAYYNMGNTFLDQKRFDAAISYYQKALVLKPDYLEVHYNLGNTYLEQDKFDQALACYQRALAINPEMVEAYYNMGIIFQKQSNFNQAISFFQKAVHLKSNFPEAYNNLGNVFQEQGNSSEAIACYQKALKCKPDYADAYYNLGKTFHDHCHYDEAISCYQKALEIKPDYYKACNNLAKTFQEQRKIDKAIYWYQKALKIKPDYAEARFNLSTAQLLKGNFAEGWKGYEWRFNRHGWKRTYPYRYEQPRWTGEPLVGKRLLIHSEQGLGDNLQFVRYLPMVKALGGTVIFETINPLMGLFKNFAGIDELVELPNDGNRTVEFDLYAPLLSLPGIFETTLETIPAQVPYLYADSRKTDLWQERLAENGLKVGLVWAGTVTDPRRSCPLAWLVPLSRIPGVHLYGLQKGIAAKQMEVEGLPEGMKMINFGQEFADFTDTAAMIQNLDLIISIDTSVAHLAGAMGKPVWVLLPFVPDWRWLLDREDCPWYPTMRLFRQETPGDWSSVIRRLTAKLRALAEKQQTTRGNASLTQALKTAKQNHLTGRLKEAEEDYRRILEIQPNHPDALNGLGVISYQTQKYDLALKLIGEATAENPQMPYFHYNLGLVYIALNKPEQAIRAFGEAVKIKKDYTDAYFNLGNVLKAQNRLTEAIENYRQCVQLKPDFSEAHYNLGNALKIQGQFEKAIEYFKEAIKLRPDYAEAHNNLGLALKELGQMDAAIDNYSQAIKLKPEFAEAHWNRSLLYLLTGNFEKGWQEYDWRFRRGAWQHSFTDRHDKCVWDGSSFESKQLLVYSEQGLGDTLQFIRYLPLVKSLGGTVIFETMTSLHGLIHNFPGIDRLTPPASEGNPALEYDLCIPLLSLPRLFNTTLFSIPAKVPYIYADPQKAKHWRKRLRGNNFQVGIVWAGRPEHGNDHNRSCDLKYFISLAEIEGVQIYGLQKGEAAVPENELPKEMNFENLGEDFEDFTDTAGLIENLDLVLSVDTSVAHLAGAMGKPVWVLLPYVPDWRWLMNREDCPWYPTMRLFRQKSRGNWDVVFTCLASELRKFKKSVIQRQSR